MSITLGNVAVSGLSLEFLAMRMVPDLILGDQGASTHTGHAELTELQ